MNNCEIGEVVYVAAENEFVIETPINIIEENAYSKEKPIIIDALTADLEEGIEDRNEMKELICDKFGFDEMVYKRLIGVEILFSNIVPKLNSILFNFR